MKSLEEKRDKLALDWLTSGDVPLRLDIAFEKGWDACAKEYEKENTELKKQLDIAKNCLNQIMYQFDDYDDDGERYFNYCNECNSAEFAEKALNDLESAGES